MADLHSDSNRLDDLSKKLDIAAKASPIAVRLDILDHIISDLDENPDMKALFGPQVSSKLALYYDGRDMRFVEAGFTKLTPTQEQKFVETLKTVITANISPHLKK